MGRYIIRRLLWAIVLLLIVSAVTFVIFYLLPSADPAALRAGKSPNPALIAHIRHTLGLDRPVYTQYWLYIKGIVLHFNFGYSYQFSVPVKTLIFNRLPATILMALLLFSRDIGRIHLFDGAGAYVGLTANPGRWFGSLILPWLVLATAFAAFYARLLRANLIETMSEDYIRTARAKGVPERRVIMRHGVRSAITPIVTVLGLDIGTLMGGAILTETVFNIPGVGRLAYEGIVNSDLPVIQGTVLFGAFFIVIANLVVDVVYAYLDPRVRYS
jgi:peptide/nickel transport system permease protein